MPDQYGRVGPRDWGAITNIFNTAAYMGQRKDKAAREKTLFDQQQEDRAFDDAVKIEKINQINQLIENGTLDKGGNLTTGGKKSIVQSVAESTPENMEERRNLAKKEMEASPNALAKFTAATEVNKMMYEDKEVQANIIQLKRDEGKKIWKILKSL